jgi:hypothetical protein
VVDVVLGTSVVEDVFLVEGVVCVCGCCAMNEDSVLGGRIMVGRWVVMIVILRGQMVRVV